MFYLYHVSRHQQQHHVQATEIQGLHRVPGRTAGLIQAKRTVPPPGTAARPVFPQRPGDSQVVHGLRLLQSQEAQRQGGVIRELFDPTVHIRVLYAVGQVCDQCTVQRVCAGRQFDKDGNNANWWDPATDLKFRQKAQCIVDQYGNFTMPDVGLNINGINTQGENIADNGGLKQAFRAYKAGRGTTEVCPPCCQVWSTARTNSSGSARLT
ncbi:Nep2 [Cordylochernes scorpioides]|uniref:Nep2 n=1 Tax=Cordylochernes scorpioides TaxID=51811 RepID=A0ABY6KZV2_9ARAC|nr:Nep2 [Cordylochernes scorpioides]